MVMKHRSSPHLVPQNVGKFFYETHNMLSWQPTSVRRTTVVPVVVRRTIFYCIFIVVFLVLKALKYCFSSLLTNQ
jgi:hypothetical protein